MYLEGKDRYLKDLDWVSIVKSIRELKAMARVLLNVHQRQILSFERDSMLPSSKLMEEKELKSFINKVPFENEKVILQNDYMTEIDKFIKDYSTNQMSYLDNNIIKELSDLKEPEINPLTSDISNNLENVVITNA